MFDPSLVLAMAGGAVLGWLFTFRYYRRKEIRRLSGAD